MEKRRERVRSDDLDDVSLQNSVILVNTKVEGGVS